MINLKELKSYGKNKLPKDWLTQALRSIEFRVLSAYQNNRSEVSLFPENLVIGTGGSCYALGDKNINILCKELNDRGYKTFIGNNIISVSGW